MKKEEEQNKAQAPKTRTITLPDGTTREVTEEDMQRFRNRRGQGGSQPSGSGGGSADRQVQ